MQPETLERVIAGFFDRLSEGFTRLMKHEQIRAEIRRERKELRELDERMLRDIGKSREDALVEAMRPDWDIPESRLRHVPKGSYLPARKKHLLSNVNCKTC